MLSKYHQNQTLPCLSVPAQECPYALGLPVQVDLTPVEAFLAFATGAVFLNTGFLKSDKDWPFFSFSNQWSDVHGINSYFNIYQLCSTTVGFVGYLCLNAVHTIQ